MKSAGVKINEPIQIGSSTIMKKHLAILCLASIGFLSLVTLTATRAAVEPVPASFQYATIRWGGRENMHVVRPDGKVELYGARLAREVVPEGTDQRAFFMNLVMNSLAREGYEFAGMTDDQIVMKKAARR